MVKFRKSAVNAGSRDQQVAIVGIVREMVSTAFRFKATNGYDKISRRTWFVGCYQRCVLQAVCSVSS